MLGVVLSSFSVLISFANLFEGICGYNSNLNGAQKCISALSILTVVKSSKIRGTPGAENSGAFMIFIVSNPSRWCFCYHEYLLFCQIKLQF